jgi:hypothetical protein
MKKLLGMITGLLMGSVAMAQVQSAQFTDQEIQAHRQNIDIITETASSCLTEVYEDHVEFYKKWKISKYYGNRKPEHQTAEGLRGQLEKYNAPASLISEMEPISCIGLTVKCLSRGFDKAGMQSTWGKIQKVLAVNNKFLGTDLQNMLQQLGWKILYWNPSPESNQAWDLEDQALTPLAKGKSWMPVWGGHAYRYNTVMKKQNYIGLHVDDAKTLVGYNTTIPEAFKQVPFFVGTAHAGYHVFPGKFGQVIEAHSMRTINAFENLEVSDFNPLGPGGGPRWTRTEKYRSGVIAIPPTK